MYSPLWQLSKSSACRLDGPVNAERRPVFLTLKKLDGTHTHAWPTPAAAHTAVPGRAKGRHPVHSHSSLGYRSPTAYEIALAAGPTPAICTKVEQIYASASPIGLAQ